MRGLGGIDGWMGGDMARMGEGGLGVYSVLAVRLGVGLSVQDCGS